MNRWRRSGLRNDLLIVLAVEETRNVERIARLAHRRLFLYLGLGGAAGDIGHALEQRPADTRRGGRVVLTGQPAAVARHRLLRRDVLGGFRRALAGQHVAAAEKQLVALILGHGLIEAELLDRKSTRLNS